MILNKPVYFCFNGIGIEFQSDYIEEYVAMDKYFSPLWKHEEMKMVLWKAISKQGSSHEIERLEMLDFIYQERLFYDLRPGLVCFFENEYILTNIAKDWFICFAPQDRSTTLFRRDSSTVETILLSQMIKDPIFTYSKMNGFVALHCSACQFRNIGIIMPANKAGGKTTLLMHFLDIGAKYMGNDSALCRIQNGNIIVSAYPHMVRIGVETAKDSNVLNKFFYEENMINESDNDLYMKGRGSIANGKIQITMTGIAKLFQTCIVESTPLNVIVFPRFEPRTKDCSFIEVSREDTIALLEESIFQRDQNVEWLPYYPKESVDSKERENCYQISRYVNNSYIFSFGPSKISNPTKCLSEFFDKHTLD